MYNLNPDLQALIPPIAWEEAKKITSLKEIDAIDDKLFSMNHEEVKELYSQLDFSNFASYLQKYVEKNRNSPVRLTSLLKINGKPFTLSKHRFFEPLFYSGGPPKTLLVCGRQVGKALDLNTPIPTPTGMTTMGELKPGDKVLGTNGKPINVIAVSAILQEPESYEVLFNDDSKVIACADHLWTVENDSLSLTLSTKQLLLTDLSIYKLPLVVGQTTHKKIVSITPVYSRPMKCIEVDSPDKLYLCGDGWIPTHNSTHLGAQGVIEAGCTPRLRLLYLAPRFEQIRRFSHQYIQPFMHESFMRDFLIDKSCTDSVLQKSFKNGSVLWFGFAFLSADRVRGLAVDGLRIDEIQDINPEFLDIIRECTSSSENRSEMYAGTSKTVDNLIEQLRLQSSQAEWFMRCEACNHWNIPTVEGSGTGLTVMEMIRDEGFACAKCYKPINPEKGQWVHRFHERAHSFPSYHVPQVIVPTHFANKKNWLTLVHKKNTMPKATFINEVLGEACDEGQRLVSRTELESVCILPPNNRQDAKNRIGMYTDRVLGIDWGGKGSKLQSMTAAAVACVNMDNNIDIIFGHVYPGLLDPVIETKDVVTLANEMGCTSIAHDAAVAGEIRLSIMRDLGVPDERIINCRYAGNGNLKAIVSFMPASDTVPSSYYNIDKSKLIAAVCLAIKNKSIRFPQYKSLEDVNGDNMLHHFLAIYEEMQETLFGERRFIKRNVGMPDDFLHAVAFAVLTIWRRYPDTVPNLADNLFADANVKVRMPYPRRTDDFYGIDENLL